MKTDLEIAQNAKLEEIDKIAAKLDISADKLEHYGKYKAKIDIHDENLEEDHGKLILVTSINPTPAGEGKTTMGIGLADALSKIGKKTAIALREPSLGPVFGIKGGAAGGGMAQAIPMEDINLHFTGDIHAIGAANNLAAAMLDNHIQQGNELNIDPRRVTWKRAIDMNDRQLRNIVGGLGGRLNGTPREDGFEITAASEVMAILALANSLEDLKERLKRTVLAYTYDRNPVTVGDLNAEGAMTSLLKDAIKPNLVQTLEGTPVFMHAGPFANIAHGTNSVLATKTALKYADYVVTEAGFGADLGGEKYIDVVARQADLEPDAVVVVATIRALKMHGGQKKKDLENENLEALEAGFENLEKHVENMRDLFGMNTLVAINSFPADTDAEKEKLTELSEAAGMDIVTANIFTEGGAGGVEMAEAVVEKAEIESTMTHPYELSDSIEDKINKIVQKVYGGKEAVFSRSARNLMRRFERLGYDDLPVVMAKTQYSLSDDPNLKGRPEDFTISVSNLTISAGAGFIVALTGDVMKMPGLPKIPSAEAIDIDASGEISGLF